MGCVSSKHLKQQASIDGWTSPASRAATPRAKTITANYSVECYHRHFVSLTSTSYGSLKIESPKPAEVTFTHDRAPFSSLNQMYGKLRTLEMVDSAHINPSCNINSSMQNTFQTSIRKSPMQLEANDQWSSLGSLGIMDSAHIKPMCSVDTLKPFVYESPPQLEQKHQWSINSAELSFPETINVKEMMMGLEEAAPLHGSSRAPSILGTPNAKTSKHLKKKGNLTRHMGTSKNSWTAPAAEWSDGDDECGKENSSPFHGQQQIKHPQAKSTSSPMGNTPLSQVSHSAYKLASSALYLSSDSPLPKTTQPTSKSAASMRSPPNNMDRASDFRPVRRDSIVARRATVERGSPCGGIQINKSSPGLSSTSSASARSVQYTPTNGKVKLTLQTQHRDDATTILTPPPNPSRLRRLAVAGDSVSADSSSPPFDPDLVASYEKALRTVSQGDWNANHAYIPKGNQHSLARTDAGIPFFWSSKSMPITELDKKLYDPFECFKAICPPGGENAVVLYTTTLRGIRKTFDDCNTAREILESFGLSIDERDVSMHLEFLNELRELMDRVVSVPRMFIKGRYIGGIEEVVQLHEAGKLSELVEGLPKQMNGGSCDGCGGVRFVPCLECSGSCKVRSEEDNRVFTRCPDCNENGLIQCPICT